MKNLTFLAAKSLSLFLALSPILVNSQCLCGSEINITTTTSASWRVSLDPGVNDYAYDLIPIDDDSDPDSKPDNGIAVVGSTDQGTTGMDIYFTILKPDGTIYPGSWPKIIDVDGESDEGHALTQTADGFLLVCGSAKTSVYASPTNKKNNAWVNKYELDGDIAAGWPTDGKGKQYGSNGNDFAYGIIHDAICNKYVVVGRAANQNNDIPNNPDGVQGDGDYWVFKISPSNGFLNAASSESRTYHGSNAGLDFARAIVKDCNSGDYIVSGFCRSCDPQALQHEQLLLLKISSVDLNTYSSEIYGWDGVPSDDWDYGSHDIFQWQSVFGDCGASDGFLSLGVQHPGNPIPACFKANKHDFWSTKTDNILTNIAAFGAGLCTNADVGVAYGGYLEDNGHSAVQSCDGYLIAGITRSNKDHYQQTVCTTCQVTCNHYDCDQDRITEDIWLAKVNSASGAIVWQESIGASGNRNDGAYSIRRFPDGSYLLAGYTTVGSFPQETNLYILKFELTEACTAPVGLNANVNNYCATLSWTMDPCIPRYLVEYRKVGSLYWTWSVDNAASPITITHPGGSGNQFEWQVTAYCSPSNYSTFGGSNFTLPRCIGQLVECSCLPTGKLLEDSVNSAFTIYPNPTDGIVNITIEISGKEGESVIIELFDLPGRSVFATEGTFSVNQLEKKISVAHLPPGFYNVKAAVDMHFYQSKIVLQ